MSGPDEVDYLVERISDGCRSKLMLPRNLAKSSWLDDTDERLLRRITEELVEARNAKNDAFDWISVPHDRLPTRLATMDREQVFKALSNETYDLAAFGAMLTDPRRLARVVA